LQVTWLSTLANVEEENLTGDSKIAWEGLVVPPGQNKELTT